MELMNAVQTRRSIRRYQDREVPEELLQELLEAACWAPSADNAQPWYFVALTQPEEIAKMQETMEKVSVEIRPQLEENFPNHPQIVHETTAFLCRLGGAPVYILAFLQKDYGRHRDLMVESVAAAIQTMLLAAHERGLGTCWVNAATDLGYGPALQTLYAPDKGEFLSLVAVGWPDQEPKAPRRKPDRWTIR